MRGLTQLLVYTSSRVIWNSQPEKSTGKPTLVSTNNISDGVQQTTNPQQTSNEVTSALRPALFTTELTIGLT